MTVGRDTNLEMAWIDYEKELHPRSDVAQLYVSRKNDGRGLIGCENCVKSEENGLGSYVKINIEPLLVTVRTSRTIRRK